MNIREFAKLCGVAPTTVSRALNRPLEKAEVSRQVYERIHAKAQEIGFHVNYHAKALFSAKSNTIGCIAGGPMNVLCGFFVESIMPTLTSHGKSFFMYPCSGDLKLEAKAFELMLYNKVEAIIHIPALQEDPSRGSGHIDAVLKKYPHRPPIVSVYGGALFDNCYQIRVPEYQTGRQAALRQLACGCRKFGIVKAQLTNLYSQELIRGYRETLLECGVPPEEIREVILQNPIQPGAYEPFRGVDGIWCCYHIMLVLTCRHLQEVCDLSKLQVDTIFAYELEWFYKDLLPCTATTESPRNFLCWFGGLVIHKFHLHDLGRRAAEIALKLCDAPDMSPQTEYIDLIPETFEYGNKPKKE
ncbi:LacI family DNA-binding transcriptional regulator [Victivallis sp. Marseille-Q1083]|uniref:LacI family DNA-binding transcriptional regulator n=1 Tax=Victivallis sp. Marseille-Q1083 TaxID=2717288 RepID=UPI00158B13F8|nr:LacI family DNA-binding transcriptional regulator [Victivallis sp. Marseille-Q1083]